MNRTKTTKLLTDILIADRLHDRKYYSTEVTLDYGTNHTTRVDIMQFVPKGTTYVSDIEKGIFICYEIKSCKEDLYSGNGLNFFGEKNYIVTTMDTYKKLQKDIQSGYLDRYIMNNFPESSLHYGFMIPIPNYMDLKDTETLYEEYEYPTKFDGNAKDWKLYTIKPCIEGRRDRSTTELLFCMLRSKHNNSSTK